MGGLLARWRRRRGAPVLLDRGAQSYWVPGSTGSAVLVEAPPAAGQPFSERVGALVQPPPPPRPRANPAFSEALFVELMRAGQFQRAYQQLAPDCRAAWSSSERFIVEQKRDPAFAALQGLSVRKVRILPAWTDPRSGTAHQEVAELEVAYAVGRPGRERELARTVHLVGEQGQWRSLCYPPQRAAESSSN